MSHKTSIKFVVSLFVCLLISISGICQYSWIKADSFVPGIESSYHVLHTVNSIKEGSPKSHLYLPSVTLGNPKDKNIPWGATVPTREGDMIYTSFYSPAFLAALGWEWITNTALTLQSLACFNFLIGSITALLISYLVLDILEYCEFSSPICAIGAVLSSAVALFSHEALISHGVLYWAQSIYQLNLALSLIVVFKLIAFSSRDQPKVLGFLLIFLSFTGVLIEWTGVVFNLLLSLYFYFAPSNKNKKLAILIALSTLLALSCIFIHFIIALGFKTFFIALYKRFGSRSGARSNVIALFRGYLISYSPFILSLFVGFFALFGFARRNLNLSFPRINNNLKTIFLISCMPLLENLVLMQHATEFSFDRLKAIFPMSIAIGIIFAYLGTRYFRIAFQFLIISSSVFSLLTYHGQLNGATGITWSKYNSLNQSLYNQLSTLST